MSGTSLHQPGAASRQLAGRIGEEIAEVVEIDCACHRTSQDAEMEAGIAVLASPEMQGIRAALYIAWTQLGLPLDVWLRPAVAEWVRSKP